jgi:hypothetical protein
MLSLLMRYLHCLGRVGKSMRGKQTTARSLSTLSAACSEQKLLFIRGTAWRGKLHRPTKTILSLSLLILLFLRQCRFRSRLSSTEFIRRNYALFFSSCLFLLLAHSLSIGNSIAVSLVLALSLLIFCSTVGFASD